MVKIYKRNLSFNGRLTPLNKSRVTQIVQHHMAHKSWHLDDVHNYHKNGNGWAGIGYNYWIDFKGNIYAGRGMNIGAHASGYNSTTIGVGYQGDFTAQTMPKAQLDAGIALNKWLMGQLPNKVSIVGHNDVGSTACPGKNFRMSELKAGVGSSTSKPTHVPKPKTSSNLGLVDYLKSKGINSSYSNRKKLAKKHGISNYSGTASQNNSLLAKIKGGGKTSTSKPSANLKVDGYWGKATTRALQRYFKTPVDGVISKPSTVIKALQKLLKVKADGYTGPITYRAMQRRFKTPVDGKVSKPSVMVKELQRRLNRGKL